MVSPQITVRVAPEIYEEISRLSKAYRKPQSHVARILLEEALAKRAEDLTASQFQIVENRLAYIERRFSGWMVKLARAIAEALFYAEEMATIELDDQDRKAIKAAAEKFVREFLKAKHSDSGIAKDEAE